MRSRDVVPQQRGLFEIDSPLHGKVRGERSVMDFPFFSLAKIPVMEPAEYRLDGVTIEIQPSRTGIATMYDKEIILYVASLMVEKAAAGQPLTPDFTFTAHDFFRITGVDRPSMRDYARFTDALARLQGTQIKTNIKTGKMGTRGWFSWLAEAHVNYRETPSGGEQLDHVKVRLCEWLFRAIERDQRIYSYHHDYFKLGTVERRIYEIAHCHCEADEYSVPLERFAMQIGTSSPARSLKTTLKKIQAENRLPEYEIELSEVIPAEPQLDTRGRRIGKPETIVTLRPRPGGRRPKTLNLLAA